MIRHTRVASKPDLPSSNPSSYARREAIGGATFNPVLRTIHHACESLGAPKATPRTRS